MKTPKEIELNLRKTNQYWSCRKQYEGLTLPKLDQILKTRG